MSKLTVTFVDAKLRDMPGAGSYVVAIDGRPVAGITDETPATAREKFIEICRSREAELDEMLRAYHAAIDRNIALRKQGKPGRNWPEFNRRERLVDEICKQAGVIDS